MDKAEVTMSRDLNTGDKAPEFSLIGADGMIHTLVDYKGYKGVCFCFLSQTCKFSKKSIPEITKLQEQYKSIAFVAVYAKDEQASFTETLSQLNNLGLTIDILLDSTKDLTRKFSVHTTPHFFIFNQSKHLIYSGAHFNQDDSIDYIANALYELVGGLPISTPKTIPTGTSTTAFATI
ncbi:MAG: Thiol-disulfide oxidoreductase ResA [Chlamydiia bacterium]|nr:Thiol-disulfide oxidoreductase ResA [Chlamydiia bacterium]